MTFRALYFFRDRGYNWEERYSSFREKDAENKMKTDENTSKGTTKNFNSSEMN